MLSKNGLILVHETVLMSIFVPWKISMVCLPFMFVVFSRLWKFGFILVKDCVTPLISSSSYLMLYWTLCCSFIGFIWFPLIQRFEEWCFYFLPGSCISSFSFIFQISLDSFLAIYGTLPLIEGILDFLQSWFVTKYITAVAFYNVTKSRDMSSMIASPTS